MREHFEYDEEKRVIHLKSEHSEILLLGILTAGKFGDYLDQKLLLNPVLAGLIKELSLNSHNQKIRSMVPQPKGGIRYGRELMLDIGKRIADEAAHFGWWKMSKRERKEYIQNVVAPPHVFHDEEIQDIFDAVENELHRARLLLDAASQGKE